MEQEITMAAIHEAEQQQKTRTHHQAEIGKSGKNDPDDGQTRGGEIETWKANESNERQ